MSRILQGTTTMASWFLNPIFFWVGVGAISAPIIIHLINRMRYRRIRWAAMEFLLKSQKRNRRRLIIEQLILLALRCLLVVLAGLLVARYVGAFVGEGEKSTSHIVILDDSLSMGDHWKDQGLERSAFDEGKKMIRDIARRAGQTRAIQNFKLIKLSECKGVDTKPIVEGRLNDETVSAVNKFLDDKDTVPTDLHLDPLAGLRAAAELFANDPDRKVLYFVSDFRNRDWSGPQAEELAKTLEALVALKAHVKMVDVANPTRGETRQVLLNHDNLAVTELRPESRVAPLDIPLQFTVTVHNFSNSEKKNVRVTIKVDGIERPEGSLTMFSVPPGPTSQTFQIGFNLEGYRLVTANIEPEETGLLADNIRYAVIEVKKQVPILVIDGDGLSGGKRPGGTYFLQNLFSAAKGYQIVSRNVDELSKPTLAEYPSIFLLNVKAKDIGDKGLKNLEKYAQDGGGVAFFMGPKVEAVDYNRLLWREGEGLFPAPLEARPTETKEEPGEKIARFLAQQPGIYVRDETHPMFADLYKDEDKDKQINKFFPYISIDKYYGVQKGRWNKTPNQDELITLPNRQSLETYKGEAQAIIDAASKRGTDDKNKAYKAGIDRHYRTIRDGLGGKYDHLFQLATDLDRFLRDSGDKNKVDQPNLVEFWAQSEQNGLRRRIEQLRERVQYGDPVAISNKFGKGRVVAVLTGIGLAPGGGPQDEPWNDWPGGMGGPSFVVFGLTLQRYLTNAGAEGTLVAGAPLEFKLDSVRYEPRMRRFFQERPPEPPQKDDEQLSELELASRRGMKDLGEQQPDASSNKDATSFTFKEGMKPGMYVFHVYPRGEAGARPKPEVRAVVYNVDTDAESDLKRTERGALERSAPEHAAATGTVALFGPDNPPIEKEKKTDLSETPWFYLLILGVLVVEQALAVHLSFHLKGGEAPAARPQPAAT